MDERLISQALQDTARKEIPEDMNLWPEVQERLGRVSRSAARSRVSWVAAAVLAMLAVSVVAYAAARLLQGTPFDPGLQGASEADLVTILNLEQTIDGITVNLDYAYADSNRVSVSVSSLGTVTEGVRYRFGDLALTDDAGHTFQSMFGGGGGGGGGDGQSSSVTYNLSAVGSYDASVITGVPKELHLHLETTMEQVRSIPASEVTPDITAGGMSGGGSGGGGGSASGQPSPDVPMTDQVETVIGPFVYDFTIPYIAGQGVEPQQTVTASGITMRLQRLVIAPSMTRGQVCLDPASEPGYALLMTLTVDGETVDLGDIPPSLASMPEGNPAGCYDLQINQSLYQRPGAWTFTVDSLAVYLPVSIGSGSNGTTVDFSIDGIPDALAKVRATLEPALEPYGIALTVTDSSLKFSYDVSASIDEQAIRDLVDEAVREETPGPWVFTFDVPPAS